MDLDYKICSKTRACVKIDKQIAEVVLHSSYEHNSVLSIVPINWKFTVPLNEITNIYDNVYLNYVNSVSDEIVIEIIKNMFTKGIFSLIYNQKHVNFFCTWFEFVLFLQEKRQKNEDVFLKEALFFKKDCMKITLQSCDNNEWRPYGF